jgi:predicted nucleotidyltransferase
MDFVHPIEALVPGVQGRVLTVLANTETELTMRTVARLAGTSVNRTATVLNRLVTLGLVERRDVGTSALVRLARTNQAVHFVVNLAQLRTMVLDSIALEARTISPPPSSVIVFGSMARGEAGAESDIDILVVRPHGVGEDNATWSDMLGHWSDKIGAIAGNPINLLMIGEFDLAGLLRQENSVWREIAEQGVVLVGHNPFLTDLANG